MESQKRENILNLALEATGEERERSIELDVGFAKEEKEWTLIIKYSGDLKEVRGIASRVTPLMGGYAVIVIKEDRINTLTEFPQIEYIEKPKRLFFEVMGGKTGILYLSGSESSSFVVWRKDFCGNFRFGH